MYCFFIEIETNNSRLKLQVAEIPVDELDSIDIPEFHVHYDQSGVLFSVILQLEDGHWYDRNSRITKGNYHKGPFSAIEIKRMGYEITKHMTVKLTEQLNVFANVFPKPHLN